MLEAQAAIIIVQHCQERRCSRCPIHKKEGALGKRQKAQAEFSRARFDSSCKRFIRTACAWLAD